MVNGKIVIREWKCFIKQKGTNFFKPIKVIFENFHLTKAGTACGDSEQKPLIFMNLLDIWVLWQNVVLQGT